MLCDSSLCGIASLQDFGISELGLFPLFGHLLLEHSNDIIVMSPTIFILCNGEVLKIPG